MFSRCQERGDEQRSFVEGSIYVLIVELKDPNECVVK